MHPLDLLPALNELQRDLTRRQSLAVLSRRAGWSPFHLHRVLNGMLGETPRRYVERLRLEYAAARLVSCADSILDIALASGFASHEVFTRAFRRRFRRTPLQYRAGALSEISIAQRRRHAALAVQISPCVALFHLASQNAKEARMSMISIQRQERDPQPILFIRRRISRTELQPMLAECFGQLFGYGHVAGLPIAGWPLARYVSMGAGLWTVEAAMPLAAAAAGHGEMQAGTLPGGPMAVAVHAGPYETLGQTHAEVERWIEAQGWKVAGPPWESYVTDPAAHPDPNDWKTEVCWPLTPA